jgi:hypothetical protein
MANFSANDHWFGRSSSEEAATAEEGVVPVELDIVDRLKKLDGPDRETDAEIDVLVFGGVTVWKTANYTMEQYPASSRANPNYVGGFANEHVPRYTASIDDAIGLVNRALPGWTYMLDNNRHGHEGAHLFPPRWPYGTIGFHKAMPVAICIAFMKARTVSAQHEPPSTDTNVNETPSNGA